MGLLDKHVKEYEYIIDKEFRETMESLKDIFKENGWCPPRNWGEVAEWYQLPELRSQHQISLNGRSVANREIYIQWAKAYHQKEEETAPPEKLENLQHKLCILKDLGILDLIDEKFSDKFYKGTARSTDKARLIASLLGIEKSETIRNTLRKEDYLSTKQKAKAVETLKKHGLEPFTFKD